MKINTQYTIRSSQFKIISIALCFLCVCIITGCGGKSATIPGESTGFGNLEGYVYVNNYNKNLARAGNAAGEPTPDGKEPVSGAIITTDTEDTAVTDDSGYFMIKSINAATHTVTIRHDNLADLVLNDVKIEPGTTTDLNGAVGDDAMTMEPDSAVGKGTLIVTAVTSGQVPVPVVTSVYINNENTTKTTSPTAVFDDIAPGTYSVTVQSDGYTTPSSQQATITKGGTATLNFTITSTTGNNPPLATIVSPADGATYTEGVTINFSGTGVDPETGSIAGAALSWSSSIDGDIGTGTLLQKSDLTVGTHIITLTASDPLGATDTDSITIGVLTAAANTAPTAAIITPASGSTFLTTQNVVLSGTGVDAQDGSLTGAALNWTSSIDGILGAGNTLTMALSAGTHLISLTVTDSGGLTDSDMVTITVTTPTTNTPPTAVIATPADDAMFQSGQNIIFSGSAADTEDGILTGAALAWSSSIDGALGIGALVSRNDLSVGTHTITLTATDSNDNAATDTVTIAVIESTVNNAPNAIITTPANGSAFTAGQLITFTGGATDAEDVAITGASLVWTSSIDGSLGTGVLLLKSNLSEGVHIITLTATDSGGLSDSATVSITVETAQASGSRIQK
ncbi:MAG: carboxypeptidase regulatory-like domain-containing protein [bacterium]